MDSTPSSSPRRDLFRPPPQEEDASTTAAPTLNVDARFFSPDSRSADTDGTGATGSTEPPGAATRSLLESVQAREDAAAAGRSLDALFDDDDTPRADLLASSRRDSNESWHCVEQTASGGEQMETMPAVHLPTPEPEERFLRSSFQAQVVGSDRGLHASDSTSNPRDGPISMVEFDSDDERQILATPTSLVERDGLTDSQEDVLLAQSVTRSQSDFSHWLHETLRLAQGDGTSTIESDDALSSILEVTRHVRLGEAAYGLGPESRLSECASMLEFDADAMPDEDITISTIPSVPVHSPGVESDKSDSSSTSADTPDSAEGIEQAESMQHRQSKTTVPKHRVWPWQMLSLVLSLFLAYQRWERIKARATAIPISSPTRSIAYVPLNQSVQVSTFPTPYAVGPRFHPAWYTFVCTLLAASGAAIPSVLRRRSSHPIASPPLRESSPSTGEVAVELAEARSQLQIGIKFYSRGRSQDAIRTFSAVLELACPPSDKAIASEWLGRVYYRLGRLGDQNATEHFGRSVKAFERSIRLDPGRATPRASLGRTLFRLGDFAGAAKALRAALKRDDQLAFAHEWLAKALSRLEPLANELVERHLERAVEIEPTLYTAHAFLGEYLHLRGGDPGRTEAAKACLLRAIALRSDYPAAHMRLAFIANEQLDSTAAAQHYTAAISTRHTGLRDPVVMPASEAALDGTSPYLACYFAMPTRSPRRLDILRRASSEHPSDEVLSLLLVIESTPPTRRTHASSRTAAVDDGLLEREALLSRRVTRYSPSEDIIAHGLYALVLLTLGKDTAESAYQRFWTAVVQRRRSLTTRDKVSEATTTDDEVDRTVAYLAMAFFERRAMPVPMPRVQAPFTPEPKSPSLPPRSKKCLARSGSPSKTPVQAAKDDRTPSLSPATPMTTLRRSTRRAKAALN